MKLMTGNSNLPLAQAVADYIELPLIDASVRRFADEEIFVEIHENSFCTRRGRRFATSGRVIALGLS